jgi:MOB kinase activator 1
VLCNATSDFCTESTCPTMRAGLGYEYTWADLSSSDYATPTSVPARRYMELLMTWVDKNLNTIGGSSSSQPAGSFNVNIKIFCRRLFRVYAHVFCQHFVETSSIHTHLKYSLFHFILFMREYGLLVSEIEVLPLRDIIDSLGIPNLHFPCQ